MKLRCLCILVCTACVADPPAECREDTDCGRGETCSAAGECAKAAIAEDASATAPDSGELGVADDDSGDDVLPEPSPAPQPNPDAPLPDDASSGAGSIDASTPPNMTPLDSGATSGDASACCDPSDPCGYNNNDSCDCGGEFAWDDWDCTKAACCDPTDPCDWSNDGICDCSGRESWDDADCGRVPVSTDASSPVDASDASDVSDASGPEDASAVSDDAGDAGER